MILIFLVFCGLAAYVGRPLYLPLFARILIVNDSLKKADASIVLGGEAG